MIARGVRIHRSYARKYLGKCNKKTITHFKQASYTLNYTKIQHGSFTFLSDNMQTNTLNYQVIITLFR